MFTDTDQDPPDGWPGLAVGLLHYCDWLSGNTGPWPDQPDKEMDQA